MSKIEFPKLLLGKKHEKHACDLNELATKKSQNIL
jgi:hypothetical protein